MGETQSLVDEEFALLRTCLSTITDSRQRRGRVHPLEGVLSLSVLGLMAHCRSLSAIRRFGELHPEVLQGLKLRRSPSVPTLGRVLRQVSVVEVRAALRTFAQQLLKMRGLEKGMTVAADGKSCRGVREGGRQLGLVHLFAQEAQVSLDQELTPYHVGEAKAAQRWIEEQAAHFPGLAVLTGDALLADRSLCTAILEHGGDYMVKLKKTSQPCTRM
jgi:hypothetical protein